MYPHANHNLNIKLHTRISVIYLSYLIVLGNIYVYIVIISGLLINT